MQPHLPRVPPTPPQLLSPISPSCIPAPQVGALGLTASFFGYNANASYEALGNFSQIVFSSLRNTTVRPARSHTGR